MYVRYTSVNQCIYMHGARWIRAQRNRARHHRDQTDQWLRTVISNSDLEALFYADHERSVAAKQAGAASSRAQEAPKQA